MGLLDDSRADGVYGLEARVPDSVEAVHRAWLAVSDVTPPDGTLTRLASADRVCYVGASGNVYGRLQEHTASDEEKVRSATFLEVFDPIGVVGVWPAEDPGETAERERAQALARDGWVAYSDGEVFG